MNQLVYVVTVRGVVPVDLARKIFEAHAAALAPRRRQKPR